MAYEQFLETVRERLQALLGPPHSITLRLVPKNNGVMMNGISDSPGECPMAPTVYLNQYYSLYQEGLMSVDDICFEIISIFREYPAPSDIRPEDLSDIEKMRPLIMMRVIHLESNRELLSDVPHLPYLDLAIIFYLSLHTDENGQMTTLIRNAHMTAWGLSVRDLLKIALENTPAALPAQIHSMLHVLKVLSESDEADSLTGPGLFDLFEEDENDMPLFVLTNSSGIYGAACMLYRGTLKNFADLLDRDLIIIPSSVHEVLLVPYRKDLDLQALNLMVTEINRTEVSREDRLSDHVYLYRRKTDDISIPVSQNQAAVL